ncbi:hypothetical protein Ahy_B06g081711 [Arachis hypogaea]|uniref:Uncharacterized protein n=1 Tax=Arachis hypogaea TaxID=3818 RepID=A0A444YLT1_ARAHY|nr:hypothetical protein Ahy_B06g081711 [Arachis hypogaea]
MNSSLFVYLEVEIRKGTEKFTFKIFRIEKQLGLFVLPNISKKSNLDNEACIVSLKGLKANANKPDSKITSITHFSIIFLNKQVQSKHVKISQKDCLACRPFMIFLFCFS